MALAGQAKGGEVVSRVGAPSPPPDDGSTALLLSRSV